MANDLVMKIIMQAHDKVSAVMERVRNASSGLSGSLNELERELKDVSRAQKMVEQRNHLHHEMQRSSQAILKNRQEMKALTDEISRAGVPTKKQAEALEKLAKESEKLKNKQAKYGQQVEQLDNDLRRHGITVRTAAEAQAQLNRRHDAATAKIERLRAAHEKLGRAQQRVEGARAMRDKVSGIAGKAAMGAAGIGAAMSVPIREYAQAESAAMELRVAMMDKLGNVPAEFAQIDALATSLGDKLPGTTAEFKQLMTMLIRQGIAAKTILGGTGEAAALLAVQLKKAPAEAAEMAAKLQDATGATEKEMLGLMDRVQKLYYMGVDDNNILGAFSRLSPALTTLKMKGEDAIKTFAPLIGMLDQSGLSGESAGNALSKVFSRSMKTDDINKAIKDLKKEGKLKKDFKLTFAKDGEFLGLDNFYNEISKLKDMTTEARLEIIQAIWKEDAETTAAINSMIEKGKAGYDEFAAKMDNQANLTTRVNQTLGTVTNLWDSATGSFSNFMVAMGEAIAPEIRFVVEMIDKLTTKLGTWARENPETANTILKVVAGIGALLAVMAVLGGVLAAVIVPMAMMSWSWAQLGVAFATGVGVLGKVATAIKIVGMAMGGLIKAVTVFLFTNPFGWVILAIGLLYALWRNWETVKNVLIAGWNKITQVLAHNPILGVLFPPLGLINLLVNNWDKLTTTISNGWNWLKGVLRENPLIGAFAGPIGIVASLIANFDRLMGKIQEVKAAMSDFKMPSLPSWSSIKSSVKSAAGFSRGGYTGAGGVNEVAGIVHKGEVVFSQHDVAKMGGWQAVERLRLGGANSLERISGSLKMGNQLINKEQSPPKARALLPAAPMGKVHTNNVNQAGDNITINIHAAPNMDIRQLADIVMQKLGRAQHKQQIRANSVFYDKD